MRKTQTPEEWLAENENDSVVLVEDCMLRYAKYISIIFSIWCDENCWFINPETSLWESRIYNKEKISDVQLYEIFIDSNQAE